MGKKEEDIHVLLLGSEIMTFVTTDANIRDNLWPSFHTRKTAENRKAVIMESNLRHNVVITL